MTREENDILLKDLCARLPYGTMVYAQNTVDWYDSEICTQVLSDVINEDYIVKPYLFPLSSMTEEQTEELIKLINTGQNDNNEFMRSLCRIDYYLKNHFDYRGLIPMGLANDATNLNIY